MYARLTLLCIADVGSLGAGQAYTVHGTSATTTQEVAKGNAKLFGAGVIRHRFDHARPSGTPQGHARMVG